MSKLETRYACDCGDGNHDFSEVRKCPNCGLDMQKDSATGEWICVHCS